MKIILILAGDSLKKSPMLIFACDIDWKKINKWRKKKGRGFNDATKCCSLDAGTTLGGYSIELYNQEVQIRCFFLLPKLCYRLKYKQI